LQLHITVALLPFPFGSSQIVDFKSRTPTTAASRRQSYFHNIWMATLNSLRQALKQTAEETPFPTQPLSDEQFRSGFDILRNSEWDTYQDFIIPQLTQLVGSLLKSRRRISVLEIGPGPTSVFQYLPGHMRRKIRRYHTFEPRDLFTTSLEQTFGPTFKTESPFPYLESEPNIRRTPFCPEVHNKGSGPSTDTTTDESKYDIILLCHSIYGLESRKICIETALEMLTEQPTGAMVVVFYRHGFLHFDDLVCHRTATFPTGAVRVANKDVVLDSFASFIAGYVMQDVDVDMATRVRWRKVCRDLAHHEEAHPSHLLFSSPNMMVAFTKYATKLPELAAQVPLERGNRMIQNCEARLHRPAAIMKPTTIKHVQQCVKWACEYDLGLTVLGGSHSGHCLWPSVVSLDMSAFDKVHILPDAGNGADYSYDSVCLVVAEAGCKTEDIIRKAMEVGLTVTLGARPSVGAGLWLQGGIGHLTRLYGLSCDAVVGAVLVSVDSGQVLYVGHVPSQRRPVGAIRPENECDLLWAIKGAGTNVGIVVSVTFKAYKAPMYVARNWIFPLEDVREARERLSNFDSLVAQKLPRNCSAGVYLYSDAGQMRLGVTIFESSEAEISSATYTPTHVDTKWGPEDECRIVNSVEVFDTEMYVSKLHGGHGGGKTSSFKRCVFLKCIGEGKVVDHLVAALKTRPSPFCYIHLVQGGGAVGDVASDATAFGCRDWDFACVITGVWPRDKEGTEPSLSAVNWVYSVAGDLLSLSTCRGAYGADLGPDPRDAALAAKAFGSNQQRLAQLKRSLDPLNVLAYACPLSQGTFPTRQRLVFLVTGESGAGKDYCADIWARFFINQGLTARVVSISDEFKREYAAATGADLTRLLADRKYKERHRPAMTTRFQEQVRQRPDLPEVNFRNTVDSAVNVDVLLITGMRDKEPVVAFSRLVPDCRLLEVYVQASQHMRRIRRGSGGESHGEGIKDVEGSLNHRPSLIFNNNMTGIEHVETFGKRYLIPFVHEDLQRLANMVGSTEDFPRAGIQFRHVLGISQHPGGLALCTSLLEKHFTGDWAKVDAVACCEAGGFVYASALALRVDVPLVLIRKAGKLPPPTVAVAKSTSYISSFSASGDTEEKHLEMERDVIPVGASVVVVDDVLSTGATLCAVLQLLKESGVETENTSVMTVAEFPLHGGRRLLCQRGYGRVNIQSLLVFSGN
jgi:adenine phosphoribosyltransferase/phosphomevalonate kinase